VTIDLDRIVKVAFMIDIRKLKELVRLMVSNELTELDLRDSEEQVTLRRHTPQSQASVAMLPHAQQQAPAMAPGGVVNGAGTAVASAPGAQAAAGGADDADAGLTAIESPMVGTFYSAGSPDADAFVSVGSSVGPDTVVAIVEAMKIFNEIKAECSGTIERVLVENGASVEYGQPLFMVRPS
jgi:acetyl-CoA carboxylase biotin carboxyl carrier protein